MTEEHPFTIYTRPELQSSSLIVGWAQDAGRLGVKVIDYLCRKLGAQEFGEIEPANFFPLGGVLVEDDIAQFPESKFYWCQGNNLVLLKSEVPRSEWYKFLNLVLDVAERYCNVKDMYTVGGMFSFGAHTTPREVFAIPNCPEMKQALRQYDLASSLDYETPPGQRTTLNSFLLWVAKKRRIAGTSLWAAVPFYLAAVEDSQACKKTVEFLDKRFDLGIDFAELDEDIRAQNERIAQLRRNLPEIDSYIQRVESNLGLTEQEIDRLATKIEEYLRRRD